MIIVPVKEGENIERALKKFKRKYEKTGIVKELRSRQAFQKPSVTNRKKMESKYHKRDPINKVPRFFRALTERFPSPVTPESPATFCGHCHKNEKKSEKMRIFLVISLFFCKFVANE